MYMNLYGILFELISKNEFEKILKEKKLTHTDICDFLNINKSRYFKLLSGTKDFTELEVIKLEKFLNLKLLKKMS